MERIPLENTEFEGRNNAYLFDGERPALVDTGLATDRTREQLESGLADHGVAVADLAVIVLTHWHADHAGLAGAFQRESGATVRVHPADAGLAAGDGDARAELGSVRDRLLDEWGMPPAEQRELTEFVDSGEAAAGEPADVEPLDDGERITVGDETVRAVHAPGHTAGLTCFVREDGSVLTGDALLPHYTPNVGGADPRVEDALGKYLDTLSTLTDAGYERAYPGHRDPIEDPTARAEAIVDHHRERAARVRSVLADLGPADAWTVSAELFGDLSGIHILHGPGEAYAHLDHMERAGLVERTPDGYVTTDEDPDRLLR